MFTSKRTLSFQVSLLCRPPATVSQRKCSRCHFLPSTCHGFPAKVFQVSLPAVHLARNPRESVSGSTSCCPPGTVSLQKRSRCLSPPSTCHGFPVKVFQVSLLAFHLARNSRESVPGSFSCRPPATVFLQKRSRWETSFGGFVHYVMSGLFSRTNE